LVFIILFLGLLRLFWKARKKAMEKKEREQEMM
jgi:hypothetical protein